MSFVLLQVQSCLYRKRKTGVNFLARPQGKLHNSFYHGIWSAPKHLGLGLLLQQRQKGVCHATPSCHYYHWLTPWWALPHPLCWRRTVKCLLLSIQCVVASGTNKSEVHKSFLTQPVRHLEQTFWQQGDNVVMETPNCKLLLDQYTTSGLHAHLAAKQGEHLSF